PAGLAQPKPASTRHTAEQPSPSAALPSSHASAPPSAPSPQRMVDTQGLPTALQSKFGSSRQAPVQPSPGRALPSSHCSAASSAPSPQRCAGGPASLQGPAQAPSP